MELKIEHLSKQFKDKTAVNDVNLQRRAGLSTAARMAPFILTVDWLGWLCYCLVVNTNRNDCCCMPIRSVIEGEIRFLFAEHLALF